MHVCVGGGSVGVLVILTLHDIKDKGGCRCACVWEGEGVQVGEDGTLWPATWGLVCRCCEWG